MLSRARLAEVYAGPWLRGTLEWMVSESLWSAGYSEPAAPCPLRLPSRFGNRASIQQRELVGCLYDLRLQKAHLPSPSHKTCERESIEGFFSHCVRWCKENGEQMMNHWKVLGWKQCIWNWLFSFICTLTIHFTIHFYLSQLFWAQVDF